MGLDTVEIMMMVEDHFGIRIPDEVASNCITFADLQKVIVDMLVDKGQPRSDPLEDEVRRSLIKITVKVTGIKADDIHPESRWFGDITTHG